jgi:molecular chaperone DnaK (HSP70)
MLDNLQDKANVPSKSWFYNAVNLTVDDNEYEGDEDYKKLNLSHKIYLTYLNKKEEYLTHKLGLIKEIAKNGMPIQDLLKRIAKIKGTPKQGWPSAEEIAAMDDEKKMKHRNKAEQRKNTLQNAIDSLKKKLADQEAELEKMKQIIAAVEQTSGQANEQPEEKEALKKAA